MNEIIHVYSAFSGTFYTILKSDILLMDIGHYPLKSPPKKCKKCFNQGFLGRNIENLSYTPCMCVVKNLNLEILKEIESKHIPK